MLTVKIFEFDQDKSKYNELKHGLNFHEAQSLWEDPELIIGPAMSLKEERWVAVGMIANNHWLAAFTYRNDVIRLITCRRAREEEILIYEQSKKSEI